MRKIALCFILALMIFVAQSCNKYQSSVDRSASLGISCWDGFPSWSPDGQKISFFSNRDDGNYEIYIMNADGSNPVRLTEDPARDLISSWSPDGTQIVFDSVREGNREIYSINVDGTSLRRLTNDPAVDFAPRWSPDGKKIVFASSRDENLDIYIMNTDGSDQIRLTDNPAEEDWPSWSPDGKKIAFVSNRDGNEEIYIMNKDGTDQTRITENPADDSNACFSPDGQKLAFTSNRDRNKEIYIMNTDGSNQSRCTNDHGKHQNPAWSPDGQKILFWSDRDFDDEVYVMNTDGSNIINLTNNAPVNASVGIVPLPRSELDLDKVPYKIVFESYRETEGKENWEICLIDADGSNLINLTNTPEIDEMYPHASPDGRLVCFVADEGEDRESKKRIVYYMNIDGTDRVKVTENAYQPCWSGDGKYIAYLPAEFPRYRRNFRANKGIEIYNMETGEKKRHPNDKIMHLARLCWSPDGEWFVSARGRGMPGGENAFKADDDTMVRLPMPGCTPDISPDGKQLAWNLTDFNLNIGKLDFDSIDSSLTDHTVVVACERDRWIYHADWSPDGNYLAFSYGKDGGPATSRPAPGCNICICDLRTGKWTLVTTDGKHNKEPDWVVVEERI